MTLFMKTLVLKDTVETSDVSDRDTQRLAREKESERRSAQWKRNLAEEARRTFLRNNPSGRAIPKC